MSDNEKRILQSISDAGVTKIVVIDDALAPPAFGVENAGGLLDILEGELFKRVQANLNISTENHVAAMKALKGGDHEDDSLLETWAALYRSFLDRPVKALDPGGYFNTAKGSNAAAIRPILKLLAKCGNSVEVTHIGGPMDQVDFKIIKPQIVFLDYYLDENIQAGAAKPSGVAAKDATNASKKLLERIVADLPSDGPAVILMSSYGGVKDEADAYRRQIAKGRLFSSRFQFVDKNKIKIDKSNIQIEQETADTILDITQCRTFAVGLNDALEQWRAGVDQAVKRVWADIGDMELRDFAYLVKFRLDTEGQPLSEYLEWFFGEVLLDKIGKTVDWSHQTFATMDDPERVSADAIEGTFDGATDMVARMFSGLRVDSRPAKTARTHRLGDLYFVDEARTKVRAILTPECDLVERKSGRHAPRMITVLGTLKPISAPGASLSDFIVHDSASYSIDWDFKDIDVLPFAEAGAAPLGTEFAGTLRPLYAYELQRRVLDDIGRVGLAVAPALSFAADTEVYARGEGKVVPLKLPLETGLATCSVIASRGGSDQPRLVFHRSFVEKLINCLQDLTCTADDAEMVKWLKMVKTDNWRATLRKKLCRDGVMLGESAGGITISTKAVESKLKLAPCCQIVVSSVLAAAA